MKYWSVAFHVDATGHMVVEANTEDEARRIADDDFSADSENTEIGDAQEIVDCTEITHEEFKKWRR